MRQVVTVTVLAAVLLLTACGSRQVSMHDFRLMAEEAEACAQSITGKRSQMQGLLQSYNQTVSVDRTLAISAQSNRGLCEEELEKLLDRIEEEEDPSCRVVLVEVLRLHNGIVDIADQLEDIVNNLPEPHVVAPGENHYSLSVQYMMREHQVSRRQADSLIARVGLSSDIIEGFHIWFLYEDEVFGTFVTQGSASISPTVFAKVLRRHQLEQARERGRQDAFEAILDSLRSSGAFVASAAEAR